MCSLQRLRQVELNGETRDLADLFPHDKLPKSCYHRIEDIMDEENLMKSTFDLIHQYLSVAREKKVSFNTKLPTLQHAFSLDFQGMETTLYHIPTMHALHLMGTTISAFSCGNCQTSLP